MPVLSLSHTHTHSLSLSHTHTLSLSLTCSLSLSHCSFNFSLSSNCLLAERFPFNLACRKLSNNVCLVLLNVCWFNTVLSLPCVSSQPSAFPSLCVCPHVCGVCLWWNDNAIMLCSQCSCLLSHSMGDTLPHCLVSFSSVRGSTEHCRAAGMRERSSIMHNRVCVCVCAFV